MATALEAFAADVGKDGPVTCVGGGSQGPLDSDARKVRAPVGIVTFEPAEMTVRVRAGTRIVDVHAALAERGQTTILPVGGDGSTIGGALAVGHSSVRRLDHGPVRDALLETKFVSSDGAIVKAGGPTVKNVSGFDLCRLLVGSHGTLGFFGEVVLRTRPVPAETRWLSGECDPFALRLLLYRPSALLWNGRITWLLLEGHQRDVAVQARIAEQEGLREVDDGPRLPSHRSSLRPGALRDLDPSRDGRFVAEIGVGTVHRDHAGSAPGVSHEVRALNERIKQLFDPTARLNPGVEVLPR